MTGRDDAAQMLYNAASDAVEQNTDEAARDIIEQFGADNDGPYEIIAKLAELSPELFGPDKLRKYAQKIESETVVVNRILDNLNLR